MVAFCSWLQGRGLAAKENCCSVREVSSPNLFENEIELCYYIPHILDLGERHIVSVNKTTALELCTIFSNGMIPYREFC